MDLFPKFIIEDDCLILSKVTYHEQLVTDKTKVKGGGMFMYKEADNSFTFHGRSDKFGIAHFEDVKACVEKGNVFSNKSKVHSLIGRHNFFFMDELGTITPLSTL